MQQPGRSKGWCFTINNPTDADDEELQVLRDRTTYGVVGREVGESGTPHYQGFVRFSTATRFAAVKRLLPRAHLESQRGSVHQAADYCKKDGTFDEWGELPELRRGTKERWTWMLDAAERGDLKSIRDEYPGEYLRYYDRFRTLRKRVPDILDVLENEWWYGPTGTGKSRRAWEQYPEHYGKQLNKWWCGYDDEDTVVIEEWAPKNDMTASALKIWADRYPFNAEVKGGQLKRIRPKRIIVTSNYTMEQCFSNSEDLEPLKRRFKQVYFPATPFTFIDQLLMD